MSDLSASVDLVRLTCFCGCPFAIPKELWDEHKRVHHKIFCPNGHSPFFGDTETDQLRRERDRLLQRQAQLNDRITEELRRADSAERAVKRAKKRAAAGTCPCCNRTFSNMATHMKREHPGFVKEQGANVVPIKKESA